MRVVGSDGMSVRRGVDTAGRSDGSRLEELAARALADPPPYRPVLSGPIATSRWKTTWSWPPGTTLTGRCQTWSRPCWQRATWYSGQRPRLRGSRMLDGELLQVGEDICSVCGDAAAGCSSWCAWVRVTRGMSGLLWPVLNLVRGQTVAAAAATTSSMTAAMSASVVRWFTMQARRAKAPWMLALDR